MRHFTRISDRLYWFQDACNVFLITSGRSALAVDFGSGAALNHLSEIAVDRIDVVLHTHHHRDQCQGDASAVAHGAKIRVPEAEQDLFTQTDRLWAGREIFNNYKVRQDRFSPLAPIAIDGVLSDGERFRWREYEFLVLPTPGHTTGSVSFLVEIDGRRVAFTGDLIYEPGKVWSLSATQWTYNGHQGVLATLYSLAALEDEAPDCLCPSHGRPIDKPRPAVARLRKNLRALNAVRNQGIDWEDQFRRPWKSVLPHLFFNTLSESRSYLLLDDDGHGLMIDAGYALAPIQVVSGFDRAARRTLPTPLAQLRAEAGLKTIEAVIPTHYHDDHVCGIAGLRRMLGTRSWVPSNFAHILTQPHRHDLPCLWFDPVPIDRVLPLHRSIAWRGYRLKIFPLPGHTEFAAAIGFEVDGKRVLAIGDQHYNDPYLWNYVYQNRFALGAYAAGFALYRKFKPDLILPGHTEPFVPTPELQRAWAKRARELDHLHRRLLPLDQYDWDAGGLAAYIEPYQLVLSPRRAKTLTVYVKNPLARTAEVRARLITPSGWKVKPAATRTVLAAGKWAALDFRLTAPSAEDQRRVPVAVNLTVGGKLLGQVAECLVEVRNGS